MNNVFTTRRIEMMRGYIQQVVNDMLDATRESGRMDVIRDFAYPLPATIIAEMLGVPHQDRDQLKKWSDEYASMLGSFQYIPDRVEETLQNMQDMNDYFQRIIEEHRQDPRDDLISALIGVQEKHVSFTDNALITNCILLIAAGQETTTNVIGNAVLTLVRYPEQLARLQESPELITSAVEEILRYESPAQYTARKATENMEIGGKKIQQGQIVMLIMGAANRDPQQFPDPGRFDLSRKENRHLAFGYAAHFCLGAPLARLEAQIAIKTIFQRFPHLKLVDKRAQWRENINLRGLAALPIVLEP
jgi:pimeloyl-[acyl-carrier protein] synthase